MGVIGPQAIPAAGEEKMMNPTPAFTLRNLSALDWARFGAQELAYIRPVTVNGASAVAIHAADGTPIGAAPTEALAIAAILQHEMAPVLVH
jgi:hypothetical protein